MQGLRGKTGLTQKEAIYRVIKGVLGGLYQEGVDVRPYVLKRNDYGRKRHDSDMLDSIIEEIGKRIFDGTVPSDRYGKEIQSDSLSRAKVYAYARRISIYWLNRDHRLNGMKASMGTEHDFAKVETYRSRRDNDYQLKAMSLLRKCREDSEVDQLKIDDLIAKRKFQLFIECFGLKLLDLPQDVQMDFGSIQSGPEVKKTA